MLGGRRTLLADRFGQQLPLASVRLVEGMESGGAKRHRRRRGTSAKLCPRCAPDLGKWCRHPGLNRGPTDYESAGMPSRGLHCANHLAIKQLISMSIL